MADILNPLACFEPAHLLTIWQRQNYRHVVDLPLHTLFIGIQQRAVEMLSTADESLAARYGLEIFELFAQLKEKTAQHLISLDDLPTVSTISILIVCTIGIFDTDAEKFETYKDYRHNTNFKSLFSPVV